MALLRYFVLEKKLNFIQETKIVEYSLIPAHQSVLVQNKYSASIDMTKNVDIFKSRIFNKFLDILSFTPNV